MAASIKQPQLVMRAGNTAQQLYRFQRLQRTHNTDHRAENASGAAVALRFCRIRP